MKRLFARSAAFVVLTLFGMLMMAGPAQADGVFRPLANETVACADSGTDNDADYLQPGVNDSKISLLPVQRWSSVKLHSRLPLNLDPTTWFPVMQQNTASMTMGIGNSAWQVTSKVTTEASRFCIGDQVGHWLDKASAATGKALYDSGVVAGILVIVGGVILWRSRRGGNLGAGLVKLLVTVTVLGSMIIGAGNTTDTGFGKGSPGWWGATINKVVTQVSEAPLSALNDSVLGIVNEVSSEDRQSDISNCDNYEQVLEHTYRGAFSANSMVVATQSTDTMWRSAGMATWANLQFGNNKYASKVACRLLEFSAGVPAAKMRLHTLAYVGDDGNIHTIGSPAYPVNAKSMAFTSFTNEQVDQAMVGWAACKIDKNGNITAEDEWKKIGNPIDDDACRAFFGDDAGWGVLSGTVAKFEFGDNLKANIDRIGSNPAIADFVMHLHGNMTADQTGVLALYVVASWICAAVFSLLALAVYLAKLALVALSLFAIWVLLAGLIKINDNGSKVAELGKHYVVMAFFAFGATALMTIVSMLTTVIHKIGSEVSGGNSTSAAFWAALAPVGAVALCNLFFTKLLKAPSPFKPTSALAWGAAAGGTGLLAGVGMERMMGGRMRRAGHRLMNIGEKAVTNRLGLGKGGGSRKGGMSPLGEVAKTGAALGVGAGLAEHMHDQDRDRDEEKKSKRTNEFEQMQEAHDFFARGGQKRAESTGNSFKDNWEDSWTRLDHKRDQFQQRIKSLGTREGWGSLAGDAAGALGRRIGNSEAAQRFAQNPLGTMAKVGLAGAGMVGGALVLGVPGAAIVGGGYALKKAHDARKSAAEFRHQHGGLTRNEVEQRANELKRYREIQKAQAEAKKQRDSLAAGAAGAAAGMPAVTIPEIFTGPGAPPPPGAAAPVLAPLPPRPKMQQPSLF